MRDFSFGLTSSTCQHWHSGFFGLHALILGAFCPALLLRHIFAMAYNLLVPSVVPNPASCIPTHLFLYHEHHLRPPLNVSASDSRFRRVYLSPAHFPYTYGIYPNHLISIRCTTPILSSVHRHASASRDFHLDEI